MRLKQDSAISAVFGIAAGTMLSSGIFLLPGIAIGKAGPAASFSYLIAGLLAGAGILSVLELSTARPEAGGDYFFISRGMGPAIGTLSGLLSWLALSLLAAFAIAGINIYARLAGLSTGYIAGIAVVVCITAINLQKIRQESVFRICLAAFILILMLIYIVKGLATLPVKSFRPFAPNGLRIIFSIAGFHLITFGGVLAMTKTATGQIKKPGWFSPAVTIWLLFFVPVFFALIVFTCSGIPQASQLSGSLTPLSDAMSLLFGRSGMIIISTAAVLVFLVFAHLAISSAAEYLSALSKDNLISSAFSKVRPGSQSPQTAILLTALAAATAPLVGIKILAAVASSVLLLVFILASLSIIVLRESDVQNYKPVYKAPFYPWLQIAAIGGFCFVIFEMGEKSFVTAMFTIFTGFAVWWFYGRSRVRSESALLYLVKKIVAKEFVTGSIDIELKSIIRQSDHIIQDRFDEIIEDCAVLDILQMMTMEDFFNLAADIMAQRHKLSKDRIYDLLIEREKESSTVVSAGLAIPHIVIDGEKIFDILLARAKEGVIFSSNAPPVRTVFVLVGSRDDRNFHLQALSAIAQIIQNENFQSRWMAGTNERDLRDVVLMAKRRRR